MYYQINLYSICRGGYRKIYSGTIRVCEGRVWGVSTTNVRAWNYTRYARLSGHRALQKGRKYLLRNGYPKTCHQHPARLSAGRIGPGNQYHQLRWYKIQEDTPILKINIL